jgi:hypothetical protein
MNTTEINSINKKKLTAIAATLLVVSLYILNDANAQNMSKNKYELIGENIKKEFRATKESWKLLSANAEDLCNINAKGARDISRAKLEASFKPTIQNRYDANMISAGANYSIATKTCDVLKLSELEACKASTKENYIRDTANARSIRNTEKLDEITKDKTASIDKFYYKNNSFNVDVFNTVYRVIA